jgi:hypothetical protein
MTREDAPVPASEDLLPGAPAVGGLEDAAVPALRPQRSLGRHPDHVGVLGVDDDPRDVLGVLQAHVLPVGPAVPASVDPVSPADVASAHVLAGADPDHVRVGRIDGDAADRVNALLVEEGSPGGARVHRLPDPSRAHRHVPDRAVLGMDGDVGDATGHEGRADVTELQALERLARERPRVGVVFGRGRTGQSEHGEDGKERGRASALHGTSPGLAEVRTVSAT